jgi:serine/threonine protein kinase/WD40 repeat protein/Tfp pilus assembly protein PilF
MSESISKFEPVERLAEEFVERLRRGERPSLSEYTQRWPEFAELINEYFPAMVAMEELGAAEAEQNGPRPRTVSEGGTIPQQLGEYRILREVARGGMGIVYEAVQETLDRHVALKVLPFHSMWKTPYLERFRRESRAAARLHHTNIVPVFGVGEHEGIHYYAMQFIDGQSLEQVLKEVRGLRHDGSVLAGSAFYTNIATGMISGQLGKDGSGGPGSEARLHSPGSAGADKGPTATDTVTDQHESAASSTATHSELTGQPESQYFRSVAHIGLQVAEALEYAHGEGVLHRDIKPSNLLLDTSGRVWVTDFGLAKAEESAELTSPGDVVGTIRYMAPERFRGHADPRSDVYGLGITLYEMLTLSPAFDDSDKARLMDRIAHEAPIQPSKLDTHIPKDLETVVLKATAKDAADRYPSAVALAEDLRRFLADRPIRARRASLRERFWRWCRRNPALAMSLSGVAVLALAVVIVLGVSAAKLGKEADRARAAERDSQEKLCLSYLRQAQAGRLSGRAGRRFESLETLAEGARLARFLKFSQDQLLQFRNEAIACVALPDLRVAREWDGWPAGAQHGNFDGALERYARVNQAGNISIRRVADDGEICSLLGLNGQGGVYLSPDGRFLAQLYGELKLWKLAGPEQVLLKDAKNVTAFAFSPDSRQLAVGSADSCIRIYDLASRQQLRCLRVKAPPANLAFHPKDRQLATMSHDTVQVVDPDTEQVLAEFVQEPTESPHADWHPDGKILASVGGDGNIYLWDVPGRKQIATLEGQPGGGVYCYFNHSGDLLASAGWSGILRLWDPRTAKLLISTEARMCALRFSPDDRFLAGEVSGNKLRTWEVVASGVCRALARYPTNRRVGLGTSSFSTDGRLLAVGMINGFGLWDLSMGKELAFMRAPGVTHVLFEPGGALLTNGLDLLRWPNRIDPATGAARLGPPERLPVRGSYCELAQSIDGQVLACPQPWGAYALLADRPQQPAKFETHDDVRSVAVSPDGRWLATGSHGASWVVKVWEVATGEHVKDLPNGGGGKVAFSPDGKWLAAGGGDGIQVWATGSWQERLCLERRPVVTLAFSPDSQILAFAVGYEGIRLIHPDSGNEFARLQDPDNDRASSLTFSPNGTELVATSGDSQSIHIWDLRAIRRELSNLGLDWDLPTYEPARDHAEAPPLQIQLDLANAFELLTGDVQTSIGLNSLLLALNPFNFEAYSQRGKAYDRLRQPDQAVDDYSRALSLMPLEHKGRGEVLSRLPYVLNDLAWRYVRDPEKQHDPHKALPLAQKAVALLPDRQIFLNTLGVVYYRLGQYQQAVQTLERSLSAGKGETAAFDLFFLAMCHGRLGNDAKARDCYNGAVQWVEEHQGKLPSNWEKDLIAFQAEADAVLGKANSAPAKSRAK